MSIASHSTNMKSDIVTFRHAMAKVSRTFYVVQDNGDYVLWEDDSSWNPYADISNGFPNRPVNREETKGHALKYIGPNNEYYVCRHCFATIRHTWARFMKHKAVCADKHTK